MPYKDLEQKKQWEQEHRSERIARRRELRQIEAARTEGQPEIPEPLDAKVILLVAGAALAAYNPKLAIGAGGLTLCWAAFYKKGGTWWFAAVLLMVFGLFFLRNEQSADK